LDVVRNLVELGVQAVRLVVREQASAAATGNEERCGETQPAGQK
jgi:hypothetical protein